MKWHFSQLRTRFSSTHHCNTRPRCSRHASNVSPATEKSSMKTSIISYTIWSSDSPFATFFDQKPVDHLEKNIVLAFWVGVSRFLHLSHLFDMSAEQKYQNLFTSNIMLVLQVGESLLQNCTLPTCFVCWTISQNSWAISRYTQRFAEYHFESVSICFHHFPNFLAFLRYNVLALSLSLHGWK